MTSLEKPDKLNPSKVEGEANPEHDANVAERALATSSATTLERLGRALEKAQAVLPSKEAVGKALDIIRNLASVRVPRPGLMLVLATELIALGNIVTKPELRDAMHDVARDTSEKSDGPFIPVAINSLVFIADSLDTFVDYVKSGGEAQQLPGYGEDRGQN